MQTSENENGFCIATIRSDHKDEFENKLFENLCQENENLHNFFSHTTPQQNGVVERKFDLFGKWQVP